MTTTALKRLIANADGAGCHVCNGSEDTLISGSAATLGAAGYRGVFPEPQGCTTAVGYANARGETICRTWHDLYAWRIPLLEEERAPRRAEIIAAEGPEDASRLTVGWFRKDRLQLARDMAWQLSQHHDAGLVDALLWLLSTKDYPVAAGRDALEDAVRDASELNHG
jgi:hypothetical protein